jgi:MFS family permease
MSSFGPSPSGWVAFRNRDFRLFVAGRFLSGVAIQMQNVGVGWLVYAMTKSAWALGFVGLSAFLPALLLVFVTGHVADRFNRRLVVSLCFALQGLAGFGLLLGLWSGLDAVWPIFVLTVLMGTSRAFYGPATQALLPGLVPREHLGSAIALGASTWQSAIVVGPALGGLLYALGPMVVFGVSTLCFVLAALAILLIRARQTPSAREPVTLTTLMAGLHFIRERPVILGAISLDLFAVLLGGATALLPIYAQDILHTGPWGLGLLRSMPALGAVSTAILLAQWPLRRKVGPRMLGAIAVFGLGTIGFGLSTWLPLSMACLYLIGMADMVSVYVRQTLVQSETPDAMRGRVAAVTTVFIGASNELGEFESGVAAGLVGAVGAVVLGGLGTIGVAVLWARLFPALRQRDLLIAEEAPIRTG